MQGTTTMYSYPVATWAGFGDTVTGQGTIFTFGYLAWDKQDLPDATWDEQNLSDVTWGKQDLSDATWSTQTVS